MSDELNLENLDAVPAEEPVVEASEAAADEAAAPAEPVADLSAESDASVDNADVESDAPAATESAPVRDACIAIGRPRNVSISGFSNVICVSAAKSRRSPARKRRSG